MNELSYVPHTFDSIANVPHTDWQRVCEKARAGPFMRPAFIRAIETGARLFARFRHILLYAEDEPVACASLSLLTLDIANIVTPRMSWFIRSLPRPLSELFRLRIVLCGLPVSFGQSSLAYTPQCNSREVVLLVELLASRFSEEEAAQLILFKEFDVHAAQTMDALRPRGYRRVETLMMNRFDATFDNFAAYCGALKSQYRIEIRHSLRKMERDGAQVRVVADPSEILAVYTPEVHRLYLDVVERSAIKLEVLPIEFFHELVRQFPNDIELIVIENAERILAFGLTMNAPPAYCFLYLGVDYSVNSKIDLYFNIVYAALDAGLRKHPQYIEVGQTADRFKARLGCRRERRFAYARGTRGLARIVCRFGESLMARGLQPPDFHIYRRDSASPARERDQECTTSS